jgi:hypothetical protein
MTHINPGTDCTVNPVIINDTHRSTPNKGELVYSSVPWKIYRQDAGMGESDYAVFINDVFYCQTDDSQTAQRIVEAIRSRPHPAPAHLNTQPQGCTCEDCIRFRDVECPYPDSNITMDRCNSFLLNIEEHDAAIARQAREDALNEFMKAIEYRFEDTNNGRGVVGTIRGLKKSLRAQQAGEP